MEQENLSPRQRWVILLVIASVISIGFYLYTSFRSGSLGFPLDDAWIHQTYALNLAKDHQWAFIPGRPSGGSTSPLWTVFLSLGYLLHIPYLLWSYLLGGLMLFGLAVVAERSIRLLNGYSHLIPWVGFFIIAEWHLAWSAVSGMETLLQALFALAVFYLLLRKRRQWLMLGFCVGLSVWVRPDGLTLLGPVLLIEIVERKSLIQHARMIGLALAGFLLAFMPYLFFNQRLSGEWWPNTFFAKQAEYAVYQQIPLVRRIYSEAILPFIGAGALLIPGLIWVVVDGARNRRWSHLAVLIWGLGYIGLYAWKLPVVYQHGRYVIPAMPVFYLLGIYGTARLLSTLRLSRWGWVAGRSWLISIGIVAAAFWFNGARAYAGDVAVIQNEMVAVAQWVASNTQPDALIAAHDIGALGYFGKRAIVDLAGLISPEVIPFIRDEARLKEWITAKGADYLVVFPGWYTDLTAGKVEVMHGEETSTGDLGPLTVYLWKGR